MRIFDIRDQDYIAGEEFKKTVHAEIIAQLSSFGMAFDESSPFFYDFL